MTNTTLQRENIKNHRIFAYVLVAQFVMALGIGMITDTLMMGAIVGLVIIAFPIALGLKSPNSTLSKHAIAIGTQLMASLHIQQTMGMTEMHFQVFVMLAFLFVFRDWKVIITGTVVIAVHHVLGFASQHMQMGIVVFEDAQPAFLILLIHAAFAVIECVVLAYMAKKAAAEHLVAQQLNTAIEKIMSDDGLIDLRQENIPQHHDLQALTNLLDAVKGLAQRTSNVGEGLLDIAAKVKNSSIELDSTVVQQNTQVGSISDSMKDITSRISEVADLSQNANNIADGAKNSTQETRSAIESSRNNIATLKSTLETTSSAIGDLSSKCENISSVMQSIKSVAEQTNLLALNAAIESARAGEHGRGFAVVADEVRNLAIKSKESAEEIEKITSLLTDSANNSVDNMDNCVSLVELAVESSESATANMDEVFSSITQVNDNVTHVTSSATEQASVSVNVSESTEYLTTLFLSEREQVTYLQKDVAQLNNLADELDMQLKQFKLQ